MSFEEMVGVRHLHQRGVPARQLSDGKRVRRALGSDCASQALAFGPEDWLRMGYEQISRLNRQVALCS